MRAVSVGEHRLRLVTIEYDRVASVRRLPGSCVTSVAGRPVALSALRFCEARILCCTILAPPDSRLEFTIRAPDRTLGSALLLTSGVAGWCGGAALCLHCEVAGRQPDADRQCARHPWRARERTSTSCRREPTKRQTTRNPTRIASGPAQVSAGFGSASRSACSGSI